MDQDATHEGVSDEERAPAKPLPNPRDAFAATLAKKRREERDDSMKQAGLEPDDTENIPPEITGIPETTETDPDEEPPRKAEGDDQDADINAEPADEKDNSSRDEDLVLVKIDGQELQVPASEVEEAGGVKPYQILKAAEARLESAKEVLKQAQQTASSATQHQGSDAGSGDGGQEVTTDEVAEVVRSLQVGTEEEGVEALQKLLERAGGGNHTSNDPMELAALVNAQIEFKSAMDEFKREYPHIVSDPRLMAEAQRLDDEMIASGDQRPYSERYADIGRNITGWLESLGGSPANKPAGNTQSRQERQRRKETADQTPPAASARTAGSAENKPPERPTPRETIAKMAAARGQK